MKLSPKEEAQARGVPQAFRRRYTSVTQALRRRCTSAPRRRREHMAAMSLPHSLECVVCIMRSWASLSDS